MNSGFEIVSASPPRRGVREERDGVEFLRRNCSEKDFVKFAHIVREFFWQMGWGGNVADYYYPQNTPLREPLKRNRRRKRKNRRKVWRKREDTQQPPQIS